MTSFQCTPQLIQNVFVLLRHAYFKCLSRFSGSSVIYAIKKLFISGAIKVFSVYRKNPTQNINAHTRTHTRVHNETKVNEKPL